MAKSIQLLNGLVLLVGICGTASVGQSEEQAFRSAFLIGIIVVDSHDVTNTPKGWHEGNHDLVFSVGDTNLGFQSLWQANDIELSTFWRGKVGSIYSAPLPSIGEFQSIIALVEIHTEELSGLAKLSGYEFSCKQEELFRTIFSTWKQKIREGFDRTSCHEYARILYLQPQAQIQLYQPWTGPQPGISHLLRMVGYPSPTACVPSMVVDTVLACGSGSSWDDLAATALSWKPAVSRSTRDIPISHVTINLARYFSALEILNEIEQRLHDLSLSKLSVHEYVQQRLGLDPKRPRFSDRYHKFLQDRQLAMEERFWANGTLDHVRSDLKRNTISNPIVKTISLTALSEGDIVQQDYLEAVQTLSVDRTTRITNLIELTSSKEAALADYLRDATTAESTDANLELQRRVEYLTWIAIAIAIIGLLVGLLPEPIKKRVMRIVATRLRIRRLSSKRSH